MTARHLTLRLTDHDAQLIELLLARTGKSKSDIVKLALRAMASNEDSVVPVAQGLYALGQSGFGKYGGGSRQSARLKSVTRAGRKARRRA